MAISTRKSFPLQYPDGWRRTDEANRKFHRNLGGMFSRDRDSILKRLNKRGTNAVITSDLPLRKDGLPYSDSRCADPGIAVYWLEFVDGEWRERVLACDHWKDITQNIRAISLTVEAICGIDRWGCTEIIERAFAGFTALPPGNGTYSAPVKRRWRDVFTMPVDMFTDLDSSEVLLVAKARYRKLMSEHHPDKGGDPSLAAELNIAIAEAERELSGPA